MDDPLKQVEKALFETASSVSDPKVRAAFLARACQGDPDLKNRLEKLLEVHVLAEGFFDIDPMRASFEGAPEGDVPGAPVADISTRVDEPGALENADVRLGRYKLLERLGEGGCGVVYLAEQREPVQRRVALKIIRLGMDTVRVIARFELERQALAMMNHPNIAQVLDAGATETGRPFFVMELVPGVRITDFCNAHRLDPAKRLELFVQVCLAIQHAHQKGILHRDIKPSNVLVTLQDGVPMPKVIDFGIGKAIEGRLTDGDSVTAIDQFVGTPAYMSPEQAETGAGDVDTRSDIYSLGALLYELLTGRPPFDSEELMRSGVDEMRRILRQREPLSPSKLLLALDSKTLTEVAVLRQAEPARLIASLRGDLDWIVMKAMEKDRQRRYATANGLAIDVQRYLRNEPVSARPPSRLYWFGKLVRRNRVGFAAGAAVAAALIIGMGTSTVLFFREREARQQQARLLEESEKNEKITRAAFLVREEKIADANAILEGIATPPARPSYDGVSAFRAVGDWLAAQQRWREAAARYAVVVHLDRLDIWDPVTLDCQSYGALLMEIGDLPGYDRFCAAASARYATETNDDAVTRILKTCLLRPQSGERLAELRPMGERARKWAGVKSNSGWALIPASLWCYRGGDFREAAALASGGDNRLDSSLTATLDLIKSMALARQGQLAEARSLLGKGRTIIEKGMSAHLAKGDTSMGFWYDWVFAHILLREAEAMIGK
jgi:serine/threonine protein kinase